MRRYKISITLSSGSMHFLPVTICDHTRDKAVIKCLDGLGLAKFKHLLKIKTEVLPSKGDVNYG